MLTERHAYQIIFFQQIHVCQYTNSIKKMGSLIMVNGLSMNEQQYVIIVVRRKLKNKL